MTLGSAGVFFWCPSPDGQLRQWVGMVGGNTQAYIRDSRAREKGLFGCTPLLPGDLFLATGTFQHHLHHGSLSYTDAARVHELVSDGMFQADPDANSVLMSDNYQKYFDQRLGLLPDRSVITFRRIENHQHGCPEVVDQNEALPWLHWCDA